MKRDDDEEEIEKPESGVESGLYSAWLYLSQYGSYLLFAVALAVLGYQVYGWYQTQQERKLQNAWAELGDASGTPDGIPADPKKLRTLINQYDLKPVQAQAYVTLGDYYLDILNQVPQLGEKTNVTPDQAKQAAIEAYNKVLTDYNDQTLAVVHARLNLGKVYEDQGDWDQARQQYQAVVDGKDTKDTAFADEAANRIQQLDQWKQPVVFAAASPTTTLPGIPSLTGSDALPFSLSPDIAGPTTAPQPK